MGTAREACGLFGLWGDPEAAAKTYYGLFALQHRGQESAGITSTEGQRLISHRGMGTLPNAFSEPGSLSRLRNPNAIGHVRYSTTGSSLIQNAQPLTANTQWGPLAAAHNGNLVNAAELRARFESSGSIFQTTADSEVILHLMASATEETDLDRLIATCRQLEGAFSLVILTRDAIYAIRDPQGLRPLWIGQTEEGAYAFASETPAFDLTHVTALREVEPGTIAVADANGLREVRFAEADEKHCVFEHVYFSRPDGILYGDPVQLMRRAFGRALAREHPVEADCVIAIPDSGNAAALGYSLESGIPLEHGFIRNHYVGRTFIQPDQADRSLHADLKLNVVRWAVEGKRVVVVDDSVVRGTTATRRCDRVREAGATEVHLRISCPPIRHPCFYGVDFQSKGELIAANADNEEIRRRIGVDTLGYLSVDGMLAELSKPKSSYCTACWTGEYPVKIPPGIGKKSCGETLLPLAEV